MIESTPISVKISNPNFHLDNLSGIGKIIRGDHIFYLDIGNTKIPLGELQESTFSDGENVRYFISNHRITIIALSSQESLPTEKTSCQPLENISDLLSLSNTSDSSTLVHNNSKTIFYSPNPNSSIPPGIYLFSSSQELYSLLKKNGIENLPLQNILIFFTNNPNVTLQIENIIDEEILKITPLSSTEVQGKIADIIKSFNSLSMKSVSETFLEEFLAENRFLSPTTLIELDKALCEMEKNLQIKESELSNIPPQVFLQWLKIALIHSDKVSPFEIVKIAPFYKAASFITDLEKIFQIVSSLENCEKYQKEANILKLFLMGEKPEIPDFISRQVEKIGFTLEHRLATENKVSLENVKAALLSLQELFVRELQNSEYNYFNEQPIDNDIVDILTQYREVENLFRNRYKEYGISFNINVTELVDFSLENNSFREIFFTKEITKLSEFILRIYDNLSELIKNVKDYHIPLKPDEILLLNEVLEKVEKIYKHLSTKKNDSSDEIILTPKKSDFIPETSLKQHSITQQHHLIKFGSNLIDKIESLQLLAQKVPDHNGASQIIALPVKIDDEWTDVTIQLFNRQEKKKSRHSRKFSVFIDIAPRVLGRIHINLDYFQNKKLQLCAEFEKEETYNWFFKRKEELKNALSGYGVLLLSIIFKRISTVNSESKKSYHISSTNRSIDIKI